MAKFKFIHVGTGKEVYEGQFPDCMTTDCAMAQFFGSSSAANQYKCVYADEVVVEEPTLPVLEAVAEKPTKKPKAKDAEQK